MTAPIAALLDRALARRRPPLHELDEETDCQRLVNGSGDGLEGLTADRLGPSILVEQHDRDVDAVPLIAALAKRFPTLPLFFKERWSPDREGRAGRQVRGPEIDPGIVVREGGLRFRLRLTHEEHVGLFLDARPVRRRVRELAEGRRVLNLFSYTCGFGVAAAAGKARATTNVDNKRSALEIGRANYELNELAFDGRTFLRDDAIRHLTRAAKGAGRYDLVVVDPPPRFERASGKLVELATGYARLIARCVPILDSGGQLLLGANALTVTDAAFDAQIAEAAELSRSRLEVMERIGPGADFPPAPERPVARFVLLAG